MWNTGAEGKPRATLTAFHLRATLKAGDYAKAIPPKTQEISFASRTSTSVPLWLEQWWTGSQACNVWIGEVGHVHARGFGPPPTSSAFGQARIHPKRPELCSYPGLAALWRIQVLMLFRENDPLHPPSLSTEQDGYPTSTKRSPKRASPL